MVYSQLKLDRQLCFPLYAASKKLIQTYKPYLDPLNLTYTQYIVMMVLWEFDKLTVKELGEHLWLDSGTLTPVLKKLEKNGLITRKRKVEDERNLVVTLTKQGRTLKDSAERIPHAMLAELNLTMREARLMHGLLYKMLKK